MRCSSLTVSTAAALVVAAACALAVGSAAALPLAGADAVASIVQHAAHKPKYWYWDGGWWRHEPWSDHAIQGRVITRPWPGAVFVPWGAERLRHCAAKYRSFDPATGTYMTRSGKRRICH